MYKARRTRLFWRLLPSYLLIMVVAVAIAIGYALHLQRTFYLEHIIDDLGVNSAYLLPQIRSRMDLTHADEVQDLCLRLGHTTGRRITIVLANGTVLCDSQADMTTIDNHANRPEIVQAMAEGVGHSVRYSHSVHTDMVYVARAVQGPNHKPLGVIRVAMPIQTLNRTLATEGEKILLGSLLILILAALISLLVARRITRPLQVIRKGAERIARGESRSPLPVPDIEEFASLVQGLNRMVRELDQQLLAVSRRRNELTAILDSMMEGVLVVNERNLIATINPAACRLLGVGAREAVGRPLSALPSCRELEHFAAAIVTGGSSQTKEVIIKSGVERTLKVSGTMLEEREQDDGKETRGAVLVLRDISESKRLENVRRDFVANVSHELRTPLTTVKGFAETLVDEELCETDYARHFLDTIVRQTDRMTAIIEDLLSLARIERLEERHEHIRVERCELAPILEAARVNCLERAKRKGIRVENRVAAGLAAWVNPSLLEQALTNLIDNAVKYNEAGGLVTVEAAQSQGQLVLHVSDQGAGIAAEHLPRLFERFYRVDPSRSRELGGTGLGLAIVKHIAQAHGGHIDVSSEPGHGSRFSIILPAGAEHPEAPGSTNPAEQTEGTV